MTLFMRFSRVEGGEQGVALMPALLALGQHDALIAIQARLRLAERVFAFVDDIDAGGPHLHPNPPWQNPVVEQGGRQTLMHRVEGRRRIEPRRPRRGYF